MEASKLEPIHKHWYLPAEFSSDGCFHRRLGQRSPEPPESHASIYIYSVNKKAGLAAFWPILVIFKSQTSWLPVLLK